MASLTSALNYAIAGLSVASAQSSLASRNVAGAQDPNYSRRSAEVVSLPGGLPSASSVIRSADRHLSEKLQEAVSQETGRQAVLDAVADLAEILGDPASDSSLPAVLSRLHSKLLDFENIPANFVIASEAVAAARTAAETLNRSSAAVREARRTADGNIAASVERIRSLLDQFKISNDSIVRGSGTPSELADSLDNRDRILKALSEEIGIRTVNRARNDVAIYTNGGVVLFETSPRAISFSATPTLEAGVTGATVTIDGVDILSRESLLAGTGGKLQANATIRDQTAPAVQWQLDEVARSLVEIFSETGPMGELPATAGLFKAGTSAAVPPSGAAVPGIAGNIRVHELAETSPFLLRDGGFGGPGYTENSTGAPGFQSRLSSIQEAFGEQRSFAPEAQLGTSLSIIEFGAASVGWIGANQAKANDSMQAASAHRTRYQDALLRVTGVNIDEEMAAMLDLEKSYQASARVLATVDAMLAALLDAAR